MSDENLIKKMSDYEEEISELKTQVRTTVNLCGQLVSMVKDLAEVTDRFSSTQDEMNNRMVGTTMREPPAASPEAAPRLYEEIPPLPQPVSENGKRKRVEGFKVGVKRVMRERWSGNSLSGGPLSEAMTEEGYARLYRKAGELVKDLGASQYVGGEKSFENLKDTMKAILIDSLAREANSVQLYIGQCHRNWMAKEFLSLRVRNFNKDKKKPSSRASSSRTPANANPPPAITPANANPPPAIDLCRIHGLEVRSVL
ncbi:hypothetical protein [Absidia glauca]|uniref:Uncharacterized protein n=1 Tax=Absidia glauca TaxID=4829 RepID=A0A168L963_ABSGL|nr:hypothetical protein [Absidia glauca]